MSNHVVLSKVTPQNKKLASVFSFQLDLSWISTNLSLDINSWKIIILIIIVIGISLQSFAYSKQLCMSWHKTLQ